MDPNKYGQLIFNKDVKVSQWIGDTLKQMILEQLELIAKKKKKKKKNHTLYKNNYSVWIIDLNIKYYRGFKGFGS